MNFKWSVIMCCYNSKERLGSSLKHIFQQNYLKNTPIELVIVDNNSSDGLKEYILNLTVPESVTVKFVFEFERGLSAARRAGVLSSSGDYICWVDDDNDLESDYLMVASQIFDSDEKICFLGGESSWPSSFKEEYKPRFIRRFSRAVAVGKQRQFNEGYLKSGDFLWGAGLCMRRAIIVGLYKSGFQPVLTGRLGELILSGEDGELTILLQLSGGLGFYSNRLQLQHRIDNSRFTYHYFCKLFFGMGLAYPTIWSYRRQTRIDLLKRTFVKTDNNLNQIITSHSKDKPTSRPFSFSFILFAMFFVAGLVKGLMKGFHYHAIENVSVVSSYYKKNKL